MRARFLGLLLLSIAALLAVAALRTGPPPPAAPSVMTVAAYLEAAPASPWVRLTGGRLDVLEGAFVRSKAGEYTDLLVPLRTEEDPVGGRIRIVVRIQAGDPLFEMLRKGDALKDEAEAGAFLKDFRKAMVPRRAVEGMVRPGAELGERDQRKLQGMKSKLTPAFVLLEEGSRPTSALPAWPLLAGAGVAAILGLVTVLRRRHSA